MTNEKLGVLLIDAPDPSFFKYFFVILSNTKFGQLYDIEWADYPKVVEKLAYKCTREEAKKHPQFRWVALEDL